MTSETSVEIRWARDRKTFTLEVRGPKTISTTVPIPADQYPALLHALDVASHNSAGDEDWLETTLKSVGFTPASL